MNNRFWLLMATVLAVGCSSSMETRVQEKFPDRPPAYREGYIVGCGSGHAEAAHIEDKVPRDVNRIQSDQIYAKGWFDGFESCRDSYRPSPRD